MVWRGDSLGLSSLSLSSLVRPLADVGGVAEEGKC
jgi:hypothetical protein